MTDGILRGRLLRGRKLSIGTKTTKQFETKQMHLLGKKKKKCSRKRADLSTEKNLVIGDPTFCLRENQENYDLCTELDESGSTYVAFSNSNLVKTRKSAIKLH